MTFKHIKFNESEIMRSLEKLAREKGLIEEDVVIKLASKKDVYTPTNNFTENILKLCSGLRKKNLLSQASELEENFLEYKTAAKNDLSDSHDGDKLIKEYHPTKSISYGDSIYGVIENLVEEHDKILEVVNKQPTGKLASKLRSSIVVLGNDNKYKVEIGDAVLEPKLKVQIGDAVIEGKEPKESDYPKGEFTVDVEDACDKVISSNYILRAVKVALAQIAVSDTDKKKYCFNLLKQIPAFTNAAKKILNEVYITVPNTFDYSVDDEMLDSFNSYNDNLNSLINNATEENINFDYLNKVGLFLKSLNGLSKWFGEFYSMFSGVEHKNYVISKQNAYQNNFNEAMKLFTNIKLVLNGSKDEEVAASLIKKPDEIKQPNVEIKNDLVKKKLDIIQKKINDKKRKLESLIYYFESGASGFDREDSKIAADYLKSEFMPYIDASQKHLNDNKENIEYIDELYNEVSQSLDAITNSKEYVEFIKQWNLSE